MYENARLTAGGKGGGTPTLGLVERLQHVGNEVAGILQAHREPHQPGRDAERRFLVVGQALMRGRRRMGGDGFRIAEVVRDHRDLQTVETILELRDEFRRYLGVREADS